MPSKPNMSKLNSALRQLKSASNKLNREGRKLESAGRQLDRESRKAQSALRRLPSISPMESTFLESVRASVAANAIERPHDVFLSHATADLRLARELHQELEAWQVEVWMDDFSIKLGQNIVRAIDRGISLARVGVVLVTPAVLAGRYWVEKEFSALLNCKETVIPVLHDVSWDELKTYSPLLHINKGLTTQGHTVPEIAELIADTLAGVVGPGKRRFD